MNIKQFHENFYYTKGTKVKNIDTICGQTQSSTLLKVVVFSGESVLPSVHPFDLMLMISLSSACVKISLFSV